jgi:hypothetical protein
MPFKKGQSGNVNGRRGKTSEPAALESVTSTLSKPQAKKTTEEVYQEAIRKGLMSDVAIERVAAMKAYSDEHNPTLGQMQTTVKNAEAKTAEAEAATKDAIRQRDGAQFYASLLKPKADRLPVIEAELNTLRRENEAWRAEQVRSLTAESAQQLRQAERARVEATEKLKTNEQQFSRAGYSEFLERLKTMVQKHNIQVDFWAEAATMSPSFYEVFGWSPIKAKLWSALRSSWPTDSAAFRQAALKSFIDMLPIYPFEPPRTVPDDAFIRKEFFVEAAKRFNCLDQIEGQAEEERCRRAAESYRASAALRNAGELEQQRQLRRFEEANAAEHLVSTVPLPHELGCVCPLCGGAPVRFGNSLEEI